MRAKKTAVTVPKMTWRKDFKRNWPVYLIFLVPFHDSLHYADHYHDVCDEYRSEFRVRF